MGRRIHVRDALSAQQPLGQSLRLCSLQKCVDGDAVSSKKRMCRGCLRCEGLSRQNAQCNDLSMRGGQAVSVANAVGVRVSVWRRSVGVGGGLPLPDRKRVPHLMPLPWRIRVNSLPTAQIGGTCGSRGGESHGAATWCVSVCDPTTRAGGSPDHNRSGDRMGGNLACVDIYVATGDAISTVPKVWSFYVGTRSGIR